MLSTYSRFATPGPLIAGPPEIFDAKMTPLAWQTRDGRVFDAGTTEYLREKLRRVKSLVRRERQARRQTR